MNVEDRAREAAENAIRAAEDARRKSDKLISIASTPDGMIALTETGRLFQRMTDPKHHNDGRTRIKFMWLEIEGPLG